MLMSFTLFKILNELVFDFDNDSIIIIIAMTLVVRAGLELWIKPVSIAAP